MRGEQGTSTQARQLGAIPFIEPLDTRDTSIGKDDVIGEDGRLRAEGMPGCKQDGAVSLMGEFDEGGTANNLRVTFTTWWSYAVNLSKYQIIKVVSVDKFNSLGFQYFLETLRGLQKVGFTSLGQAQFASGPLQQRDSQSALEGRNLGACCRVRDPELLGRARKASRLRDPHKHFDFIQIHFNYPLVATMFSYFTIY